MTQTLKERVQADLISARKKADGFRLETLKMVLSQIQAGETSATPVAQLESVKRYRKSLQKSIELAYTSELEREIQIVDEYLEVDKTQLEPIMAVVRELRTSDSNKGFLMKELKTRLPDTPNDLKLAAIDEVLKTPY